MKNRFSWQRKSSTTGRAKPGAAHRSSTNDTPKTRSRPRFSFVRSLFSGLTWLRSPALKLKWPFVSTKPYIKRANSARLSRIRRVVPEIKPSLTRIATISSKIGRKNLQVGVSSIYRRLVTTPKSFTRIIPQIRLPFRRPAHDLHQTLQARASPGSRTRRYLVHVPPGYTGRRPVPLVMVLHGCMQSNETIRDISNFDTIADRAGFIVVYPFVTSYPGFRIPNCWGWWSWAQIRPGRGEVGDLWRIVETIKAEFNIDPARIHVAGLSSGAAMAVALMVAQAQQIASGATVAGVPYSESARAVAPTLGSRKRFKPIERVSRDMTTVMGKNKRGAPIFIVHSHDDATVDIQAARNIRDSWAQCFNIDVSKGVKVRSGKTHDVPWVHKKYRDGRRRSRIETLFIKGAGHGWYGGSPGELSYPEAPNISRLIWKFFRHHRL